MKKTDDQIDFNFSRVLDIQKNLDVNFLDGVLAAIKTDKKNNSIFYKHLKLVILELYYCWHESKNQMLAVSMSKRGYLSRSRYNPNKISSYIIKVVHFLKKEEYIEFFPGFYDSKRNVSRLSRIKASKKLSNFFEKVKRPKSFKFNAVNREYLIKTHGGKKIEYSDNYETQEIKEIIKNYNEIISKVMIDIPLWEKSFIERYDNTKVVISRTGSQANYIFLENTNKEFVLQGCWWNRIDIDFLNSYSKQIIINDSPTVYFDFSEKFNDFLKKKLGVENFFKKRDSEKYSNTQICYLIVKAVNSKNFESFFRSTVVERKKFFSNENLPYLHVKKNLEKFVKNNENIANIFFQNFRLNWDGFLTTVFFKLLKTTVPANIPVFLIKDKIYCPLSFSEIVKSKLNEILKSLINEKKGIGFKECVIYNYKSKSFFSKLFKSNKSISKRYLNRVKDFR